MTVDDIYQRLVDNRLEIRNRSERKNNSEITGYEVDGEASTFYVGSKKLEHVCLCGFTISERNRLKRKVSG